MSEGGEIREGKEGAGRMKDVDEKEGEEKAKEKGRENDERTLCGHERIVEVESEHRLREFSNKQ
jgi:hypothetical protein